MGRVQYGNRWSRSRRIQGIGQQIVVKKVLIATEAALQVVPLVLVRSKPQNIVRIASPSETVEVKIVEEQPLVVHRLHRERFVEKPWTSMQIHQSVIHITAAGHIVVPIAQFNGRMNQITAAGDTGWLAWRGLISAGSLRKQHAW